MDKKLEKAKQKAEKAHNRANAYTDKMDKYAEKRQREADENKDKKKNAVSLKAAGHKTLAKVYEINENFYKESNKTLSSMNKAAKTVQLKKAQKAQEEANAKKESGGGSASKYVKIGAAAAATGLAAYGTYKLASNSKTKALVNIGKIATGTKVVSNSRAGLASEFEKAILDNDVAKQYDVAVKIADAITEAMRKKLY